MAQHKSFRPSAIGVKEIEDVRVRLPRRPAKRSKPLDPTVVTRAIEMSDGSTTQVPVKIYPAGHHVIDDFADPGKTNPVIRGRRG